VPVGYFYHDGIIYIPTNSRSVKIRNLIHNSKCCVIVDTYEDRKGKGVMVQGEAKIAIGNEFLALKTKLEKLSGLALNNWRVGTPPRDRVDAIIMIESKVTPVVIGSI
jgi:nitroimidazol reductase NimA-like FMN-containing flavoprotein (pyridoxamine 5'-phosphate oxidase superfamily)